MIPFGQDEILRQSIPRFKCKFRGLDANVKDEMLVCLPTGNTVLKHLAFTSCIQLPSKHLLVQSQQ